MCPHADREREPWVLRGECVGVFGCECCAWWRGPVEGVFGFFAAFLGLPSCAVALFHHVRVGFCVCVGLGAEFKAERAEHVSDRFFDAESLKIGRVCLF